MPINPKGGAARKAKSEARTGHGKGTVFRAKMWKTVPSVGSVENRKSWNSSGFRV
jgi:hypothetical protein